MKLVAYKKYAIYGVALFAISLTWLLVVMPISMRKILRHEVALKKGWPMRGLWEKYPFPLLFHIYVFNVTNPTSVSRGEKPALQQIGPFVYDEWIEKTSVQDHEEDDSVSYLSKRTYRFNAARSKNYTGDEEVVIPHLFAVGLINGVLRMKPDSIILVGNSGARQHPAQARVGVRTGQGARPAVRRPADRLQRRGLRRRHSLQGDRRQVRASEAQARRQEALCALVPRHGKRYHDPGSGAGQARYTRLAGPDQDRLVRQQDQARRLGRRGLRSAPRHGRLALSSVPGSRGPRASHDLHAPVLSQPRGALRGQGGPSGRCPAAALHHRPGRRRPRHGRAQVLLSGRQDRLSASRRLRSVQVSGSAAGHQQSALLSRGSRLSRGHWLGSGARQGQARDRDRRGSAAGDAGAREAALSAQHTAAAGAGGAAGPEIPRGAAAARLGRRDPGPAEEVRRHDRGGARHHRPVQVSI
uniref:Uncharacterized protein n=1 Tax=Trichogramma kaykai TaxID=54128 RepID=A0ABD2XIB3_9HYME